MTDWDGSLPALLVNDIPTATEWAQFMAAMRALSEPGNTYSLVWSASAGIPVFGNSSVTSTYRRMGHWYDISIQIQFGNTGVVYGNAGATWRFSLPSTFNAVATQTMGSANYFDASAGLNYPLLAKVDTNQIKLWRTDGAGTSASSAEWTNNSPVPATASDALVITIRGLEST